MEPNRGNMALGDIMTLHKRATVVGAALAAGLLWMAPANAQAVGTVTATLTINDECLVATRNIVASTTNFTATDVTFASTGTFSPVAGFPAEPVEASGNVAVVCSSGTTATVTITADDDLTDGGETLAWTPTGEVTAAEITGAAPTITYYTVGGTVSAVDIQNAVPGTYTGAISVSVDYTP
jgi:hypothetical protein